MKRHPLSESCSFKETKVGLIPSHWNVVSLADICQQPISGYSANGNDQPANKNEVGVLKLSCIQGINFKPEKNKLVKNDEIPKLKINVKKGTIIFSRSNTEELVGAACYVNETHHNLFLSDLLWEVSLIKECGVDPLWLTYLLNAPRVRAYIVAKAAGTSGSMKKINKRNFLSTLIPLPPFKEQRKIAEIVSTWDAAIKQIHDLLAAKQRRKKALMQQLLTGNRRLPGCNGGWDLVRLGKIFSERKESNRQDLPLLAITSKQGVISASDNGRKDSSSEDKSRYKRIAPGDIGYNTMRMWQGVSALSRLEGIVSPAYTICTPITSKASSEFLAYLFKHPYVIYLFWRHSQGLVNDTLNLKYHHFAQIKVKIPELLEQEKIAEILACVDQDIELLNRKLDALEKQKRGLMQKLLTGEVRVQT